MLRLTTLALSLLVLGFGHSSDVERNYTLDTNRLSGGVADFSPNRPLPAALFPGHLKIAHLLDYSDLRGCDGRAPQPRDRKPFTIMHAIEFLFALEEINSRDDLLPNITLGSVWYNTCGQKQLALEEVLRMTPNSQRMTKIFLWPISNLTKDLPVDANEVVGIVGPGYSSSAREVSPLLELFKIPAISPTATSAALNVNPLSDPYFFRSIFHDRNTNSIATLILHYDWKYVNFLYTDGPFGEDYFHFVTEEITKNGVCLGTVLKIDRNERTKAYFLEIVAELDVRSDVVVPLFDNIPQYDLLFEALSTSSKINKFFYILMYFGTHEEEHRFRRAIRFKPPDTNSKAFKYSSQYRKYEKISLTG